MQTTTNSRSFVIPVLDMSPASPFNIVKLLDDLKDIDGDVIIIFNSLEMADKLSNHPRINYYAVMSHNVGVARAWNIGLDISQTPVTFILNSDLHIEKSTVVAIEEYINSLDKAAIVGPQGSFFDFNHEKDMRYFDKGTFKVPVKVDAVSGFFFAVKTEYFHDGTLYFENKYTPCYFEEWDLGLQIRKAGLCAYVVPVGGYEHEWSGSIRALRAIRYFNNEDTAGNIRLRNLHLFKEKWSRISSELKSGDELLTSLGVQYFAEMADELSKSNMIPKAKEICEKILEYYPHNIDLLSRLGKFEYATGNMEKALEYFETVQKIDPNFQVSSAGLI